MLLKPTTRIAAALLVPLIAGACTGTRYLQDPTVVVESDGGRELGVSTDYGVVFLGRTARSGPISITSWFGSGPNIEASSVEPIGYGLYSAEIEIELPKVPLTFKPPRKGDWVTVVGRRGNELWSDEMRVETDPRVEGVLLRPSKSLRDDASQTGAGVYVENIAGVRLVDGSGDKMALLGLVSGRLTLEGPEGTVEYLTVTGPSDLWRFVSNFRSDVFSHKFVYRGDIM